MSESESAFWRFSLRFYRRPEVASACLDLQETAGVDVNLLFFILFLAINGRRLSTEEVRRIDTCIHDWRKRVVQPLRAIRRDLKGGIAPVDTQAAEALRGAIKREELHAERLQQETLEREFPVASTGSPSALPVAAAANIAAYGALMGNMSGTLPAAQIDALLKSLVEEFQV